MDQRRRRHGIGVLTGIRGAGLAAGLVLVVSPLPADSVPGPVWEQRFAGPPRLGNLDPTAIRELVDGSILLAVRDTNTGVSAARYAKGGDQLSVIAIERNGFYASTIDPWGGIFFLGNGVAKHDAYSGRLIWDSGSVVGGDLPLVDPFGDLLVYSTPGGSISKVRGATGAVLWGPIGVPRAVTGQAPNYGIAFDAAGNIFVSGWANSQDAVVVKVAGDTGNILWGPRQFPGEYSTAAGVDRAGDLFVTGTTVLTTGRAVVTMKYDGATGAILWGPAFVDAESSLPNMAVTARGDPVVIGVEPGDREFGDELLVTAALSGQTGALTWGPVIEQLGGPLAAPILTAAGNGDVYATVSDAETGHLLIWRYAVDGSRLWGPKGYRASNVIPLTTSDGNLLLLNNQSPTAIRGVNSDTGESAWGPVTFEGIPRETADLRHSATTPDGHVVVTGTVSDGRLATIKYDRSNGAILWGPTLLPDQFNPTDLLIDSAGDILIPSEGRLLKFRGSDGALLWGSLSTGDTIHSIAIAPSRDVYILSARQFGFYSGDEGLRKVSGTDGSTIWGPVYWNDEPGCNCGYAGWIAIPKRIRTDANGDVFAIGTHVYVYGLPGGRPQEINYDPPTGDVYKYDGSNGSRLWRSRFARAGSKFGSPSDLVVGGTGNVTVIGATPNDTDDDFTTIKYDGSTGAILWGPNILGGTNGLRDDAYRIALDALGNVFVGGFLDERSALVKYQWNDGALLWGPVEFDGTFHYLVLDASDNPVISGALRRTAGYDDIATHKRSGATGSVLWGPIFTGSAQSDAPGGISVRGSSIVVAGTSDDQYLVAGYDETASSLQTTFADVPAAFCGQTYAFALGASDGAPPYKWTLASGSPPPGVFLSPEGVLSGTPTGEGLFSFNARVTDSASESASRDYAILVADGADFVPIHVEPGLDCQTTLSVEGGFAAYHWLPGGETTPVITVSPAHPMTYGVVVTESSGCLRHGAVALTARGTVNPDCAAPSPWKIQPSSGPSGAAVPVAVDGENFASGLLASIGGSPATGVVVESATGLRADTPSLLPGTLNHLVITNPDGQTGTLLKAFLADFLDVPGTHAFHAAIEKIFRFRVTTGCGGGSYCPDMLVTRDQMAIFILRASHGPTYVPPAATGTVFDDLPADAFGAAWIEQFFAEEITKGCAPRRFCPTGAVTRDQLAAFLVRAEHGSGYLPPDATGLFSDVPVSSPFARWIEQLANEQITSGCGPTTYCPAGVVTRGPMAKLLARTFHLP